MKRKIKFENTILLCLFALSIFCDFIGTYIGNYSEQGVSLVGSWWNERFNSYVFHFFSGKQLTWFWFWIIPAVAIIIGCVILKKKALSASRCFVVGALYIFVRPFIMLAIFYADYFSRIHQIKIATELTKEAVFDTYPSLVTDFRFMLTRYLPLSYIPIIIILIIGLVFFFKRAKKYYKIGKGIENQTEESN